MKNKYFVFSLSDIQKSKLDRDFIFDTNVWIRIHGFQSADVNNIRVKAYSKLYATILQSGGKIFVTQNIISEYIGTSLNFNAKRDGWERQKCKIHQSPNYKNWFDGVAAEAEYIRDDAIPLDDEFSKLDLKKLLAQFSGQKIDINDIQIVDICRKNNLVLITDDGDFCGQNIEIFSFNKKFVQ